VTHFALNAYQYNIKCCTDISVERELTHACVNTLCELTNAVRELTRAVFYICAS